MIMGTRDDGNGGELDSREMRQLAAASFELGGPAKLE